MEVIAQDETVGRPNQQHEWVVSRKTIKKVSRRITPDGGIGQETPPAPTLRLPLDRPDDYGQSLISPELGLRSMFCGAFRMNTGRGVDP